MRGPEPGPKHDFLVAFGEWDVRAGEMSGRRGLNGNSLKVPTDRFIAATKDYAARLDLTPDVFLALLMDWRRSGLEHRAALEALEAGVESYQPASSASSQSSNAAAST